MRAGVASQTALGAAGHRAAHQTLEGGAIFPDPLALPILGDDAEQALALAAREPARRALRLFVAMRSRIAEDACRRAVSGGLRQIVVMGAGLDTFAYRLEGRPGLRVFELDHPDTQRDKRRRLSAAGIAAPPHLAHVAHDFLGGGLIETLAAAGLDPDQPTFVLWLGVTPYLTREAVLATLAELSHCRGGVEVLFDYCNPPQAIEDERSRRSIERMAAAVAAAGEPFCGFFATDDLHAQCRRLGYRVLEDLDRAALSARWPPASGTSPKAGPGPHVARIACGPAARERPANAPLSTWRERPLRDVGQRPRSSLS